MELALVFEKNGDVFLAEVVDPDKYILKNRIPCPQEVLATIPQALVDFCQERARSYMRLADGITWNIRIS